MANRSFQRIFNSEATDPPEQFEQIAKALIFQPVFADFLEKVGRSRLALECCVTLDERQHRQALVSSLGDTPSA